MDFQFMSIDVLWMSYRFPTPRFVIISPPVDYPGGWICFVRRLARGCAKFSTTWTINPGWLCVVRNANHFTKGCGSALSDGLPRGVPILGQHGTSTLGGGSVRADGFSQGGSLL